MSSEAPNQQASRPPFNLESSMYRLQDLAKNNQTTLRELGETIKSGLGRSSGKPLPKTFQYAVWVGFTTLILLMVTSIAVSISAYMDYRNLAADSGVDSAPMQKAIVAFLVFLGAFAVAILTLFTITWSRS